MALGVPYAWRQLSHERLKLAAAVGGITFAVVLVFMQIGIRSAMFDSSVRLHLGLDFDLVMLSPRTAFIVQTKSFPRSRLHQVAGLEEVVDVSALYVSFARFYYEQIPDTHRKVMVVGIDPSDDNVRLAGAEQNRMSLRRPDTVLMDRHSRAEFAPVVEHFDAGRPVQLRLNERNVELSGIYELGTSFGVDGSVLTSDLNFMRIFPGRPPGNIELGLVRLTPGANPSAVREKIRTFLPDDVLLLTRNEYIEREVDYWSSNTPIGYIFSMFAVIGVVVGLIIVYQILFSEVQNHLSEYATLKAIGYTNGFLRRVVLREALYLAVLGFMPALGISLLLYAEAGEATQLPIEMSMPRIVIVFVVTLAMCGLSGLLAIRKLDRVDPAEVFR